MNLSFPNSLWSATAVACEPNVPLLEPLSTDTLVIGAGFTGLSTALHLLELGASVCVIDVAQPGWGASGRNGGQVIPGFKLDPEELISRFGVEHGKSLIDFGGSAPDLVFDLIDKHKIECSPVRKGWIQTADTRKTLEAVQKRAQQWSKLGARVETLSHQDVSERLGVEGFRGGWIDYRAGSIQPLSYVRGLLKACQQKGGAIYGDTAARGIRQCQSGWLIETANGVSIKADRVVIATNGYSDNLWPGLKQTVLPANSFLVATEPLPEKIGNTILPGGEITSNARRLLIYFRKDNQGRLILGGRGPFHEPFSVHDWKHVEQAMHLMFPQLKGIAIQYRWAGRIAITRDFFPHVHQPYPNLLIALGYNGRGVAMATAMGKALAKKIVDGDGLPFPPVPINPIPFHGLQKFYMTAGTAWYRFLDAIS